LTFEMSLIAIFLTLFAISLSKEIDFTLHYEMDCSSRNMSYFCHGRASSVEIKTLISGKGEVHTQVKKFIGSVSHWRVHGISFGGQGTEIGNITFGVHTTHEETSILYHGAIVSINPDNGNPRRADTAGWMKITSGKGAMAGANGGASHSCTYKQDKGKVHCLLSGHVSLP